MKTFFVLALLFSVTAHAGEFFEVSGVAIRGFYPVAYFDVHKAVKGISRYEAVYKGSTFHFSTPLNRDIFLANPGRYAPQYAGYCAFGVSKGAKAKTEGEAFKVVDGKLYLNYDKDIQSKWENNRANFVKKADANWAKVSTLTDVVM